jgi:hypothetical protein
MWYHRLYLICLSLPCFLVEVAVTIVAMVAVLVLAAQSCTIVSWVWTWSSVTIFFDRVCMLWLWFDCFLPMKLGSIIATNAYLCIHTFHSTGFFLRTAYRMKLEIIVSDKFKNCMKSQVIKNINKLECTMSRLHCKVTNMNNFTLTNALRNNTGGRTHRKWSHFNW